MGGFPWKKAKGTARISQMVKDQFHRRKSAASPLVVQTGFPTSLIDLIVKNHERFKKPSGLPRKNPPPPIRTGDPAFLSPSPPVLPPRSPISATGMDESDDRGPIGGGGDGADSNRVLSALMKIFMLVVLALGTKKFAAGVTLSAFLLFFLEYLARNLFRYEISAPLRPMMFWVRRFIITRVVNDDVLDDGKGHPIEEIEIVEEDAFTVGEINDPSFCSRDFKPEGAKCMAELIEEDEGTCELSQSKRRKSRRAKIRSKMKKLFPSRKEIRKGPKTETNPSGEVESRNVEENASEMPEAKDTFHDIPHTYDGEVEETTLVIKQNVVERKGNYGYMILVMVALLGLVMGGRIYALTFTLTWCFLSKWTVFRKQSLHLYS